MRETGLTPEPRVTYGDAMQKPHLYVPLLLSLFTLISLNSCSEKIETLRILTDRKELASAVEIYNNSNTNTIITIHHVEGIDDEVIKNNNPDIVIGSFLSSPEIIDLLRPSEIDFPVYEALAVSPKLTPLSFELPLVMGLEKNLSGLPDLMLVQPEDLKEAAEDFTARNKDGRLIHQGFSPAWNPRFFTDLLAINAPNYFSRGMEDLDSTVINQVVEETREWISESSGDMDSDTAFNKRYRYIPDEYLILKGRILFSRISFKYWAALPDTITGDLDIRYLSGPRKIPVIRMTSAGILKKTSSPEAARAFIQWLMNPVTQDLLMSRWQRDGIDVFGYLGGLSSIPEVNESILVNHNPALKRMIPEGHYLQVPDSIPLRWPRIRDEVVIPWFQSSIANTSPTPTLTETYKKWDLSSLSEAK